LEMGDVESSSGLIKKKVRPRGLLEIVRASSTYSNKRAETGKHTIFCPRWRGVLMERAQGHEKRSGRPPGERAVTSLGETDSSNKKKTLLQSEKPGGPKKVSLQRWRNLCGGYARVGQGICEERKGQTLGGHRNCSEKRM